MDEKKRVFDIAVGVSADEEPIFGFVVIGPEEVAKDVRRMYEEKGFTVTIGTTCYNDYLLTNPRDLKGFRAYVFPEVMEQM